MKESQRQPHSPSLPSRNHRSPPAVCHAPRYDTRLAGAPRHHPCRGSPSATTTLSPTKFLIVLNPLLSSLRSFARKLPASLGKEMDTLQAGKFPAPSRTPAITRSGAEETAQIFGLGHAITTHSQCQTWAAPKDITHSSDLPATPICHCCTAAASSSCLKAGLQPHSYFFSGIITDKTSRLPNARILRSCFFPASWRETGKQQVSVLSLGWQPGTPICASTEHNLKWRYHINSPSGSQLHPCIIVLLLRYPKRL